MSRGRLTVLLHAAIVGVALCVLIVYIKWIPNYGISIIRANPEFAHWYWPWQIFLWGTGLPILAALVFAWRITSEIGRDRSFSHRNARDMRWISQLAYIDALYFLLGNFVMLFGFRMYHPGVLVVAPIFVIGGCAIGVAAQALSYLVQNAAKLQEDNDLTI